MHFDNEINSCCLFLKIFDLVFFLQIDFFARAKRLEEIPLLKGQYEKEKVVNREFWEQQEAERVILYILIYIKHAQ